MRTQLLLRSYRDRTALSKGPRTPYSRSTPIGQHEGRGRMPSPNPQSTCGLVGNSMNPRAPHGECRAGPVFYGRDENHTAPLESEVRLSSKSPLQYPGVDLPGEAEECDSSVVGTHLRSPFLNRGTPPRSASPERLEILRTDLIHTRSLATEELIDNLSDFSLGDGLTASLTSGVHHRVRDCRHDRHPRPCDHSSERPHWQWRHDEHGPLRLNVPSLPRELGEALPEV
ncbi:hypothetical protein WMY93_025356 [Mugilogobius chulae]|uniref:Uncharacterized protein n=1 Tax=Mugilogobius chulae TaxID=88201 RepID=A0AAW0N2C9_9GOBI